MKVAWNGLLKPTPEREAAILAHIRGWRLDDDVRELQEHMFECFKLYVTSHPAWMPGFAVTLLPRPRDEYGDLRVYRDDFPALRDLYMRTFETCHAALDLLVPLLNSALRGSPSSFAQPPGVKKPAKTPAQFKKLRAFEKAAYLVDIPEWIDPWRISLDRSVRNLIGHAKIRHELSSGLLVAPGEPSLPYADFLAKTHLLIHPLLAVMNAVKLGLVYSAMIEKAP